MLAPMTNIQRAELRRSKAAAWSLYKLQTEEREVERVVKADLTDQEKRRKWGPRPYAALTLQTKALVPVLHERTSEGKLERLPLRRERRLMWREAMKG